MKAEWVGEEEIMVAYSSLDSLEDIQHSNPHLVKKITIIHSNLTSLSGIQQFTNLEYLNLKYNSLQEPEDLFRIQNKELIKEVNLEGNRIESYSLCTYLSLRTKGFNSLVVLNNKDYSRWGKKTKVPSMRTINSRIDQIQSSMSKTLKRVVKKNVYEKYKLMPQIETQQQCQDQQYQTSRYSSKSQSASLQKIQHTITERFPLREISLSNANMVKSMRVQNNQQQTEKLRHNYQLAIDPIQYNQNFASHMPMTQPTATFASQKQKDTMPFKKRTHCKSIVSCVQEEENDHYQREQDNYSCINQIIPRESISYRNQRENSYLTCYADEKEEILKQISAQFYRKSLLIRALKCLAPRNMPRKIQCY